MVFLGKRCKANCTFSAEKYTWFTVWKLPPQPFHVFTHNKQKHNKNIKDQSSSPPPTSGSFKTPLHSLSVHYQSIFIVIGMSFTLSIIIVPTHTVRITCDKKATVPTRVLSLWLRYHAGDAKFPGNDICNDETFPICSVCSVHSGKSKLWPTGQRLYSVSEGPSRLHKLHVPLMRSRQNSLLRKFTSSEYLSFFLFFLFFCCFFAVTFQMLLSSKQVLLKDSH